MIRISDIKLNKKVTIEELTVIASERLGIDQSDIIELKIEHLSVDARKKPELYFVYTLNIKLQKEKQVLRSVKDKKITSFIPKYYAYPKVSESKISDMKLSGNNGFYPGNIVVIGAGPAGLFCSYALAENGYKPILLERGADVDSRSKDVMKFWQTGVLDPDSNVQFGEGGAGAFSDGKLNTQVKDKYLRKQKVTEIFINAGAPEEIAYLYHPHIGTDLLVDVIKNIRNKIIDLGGIVRFHSKVTDFKIIDDRIRGVYINGDEFIEADLVVLAIGHSARDTFFMLDKNKIEMQPKPMAIGLRIQHPQKDINFNQSGREDLICDYKLTCNLPDGRGVYSFCMCPGGYVVDSSSENSHLCVNGMSYYSRDGENANSALVVTVTPDDYGKHEDYPESLNGIAFLRDLEKKAYAEGKGKIPVQLYGDFKNNRLSDSFGKVRPMIKGRYSFGNLRNILPEYVGDSIISAMPCFSKQIKNFDRSDALLCGVESRTSSPVRINRDEDNMSNIKGLFPCGEGAGYAGGIMSAAMDGIRVAESIIINKQ